MSEKIFCSGFRCFVCNEAVKGDLTDFTDHLRICYQNEGFRTCHICKKLFSTATALICHTKKEHTVKIHQNGIVSLIPKNPAKGSQEKQVSKIYVPIAQRIEMPTKLRQKVAKRSKLDHLTMARNQSVMVAEAKLVLAETRLAELKAKMKLAKLKDAVKKSGSVEKRTCRLCSRVYSSKGNRQRHEKTMHNDIIL